MINVLAVCKNSLFIKGIQDHLHMHHIEIVAICNNSAGGAEVYKKIQPDIVLMDANWSGNFYTVSGSDLIQTLRNFDPAAKIIVSTNVKEFGIVERMGTRNI